MAFIETRCTYDFNPYIHVHVPKSAYPTLPNGCDDKCPGNFAQQ